MKARLLTFTGARTRKQAPGSPAEGEVYCTFECGGQELACRATLRQAVISESGKQALEVSPVVGLPAGAHYDHKAFAEAATRYYAQRVAKYDP